MFYKYEIKNNGIEDILYLYTTYKYEFANELNNKSNTDLNNISLDYITRNNIDFKGNKIYFVVDGLIVKKVDIRNNNLKRYGINSYYSPDNFMVIIRDNDNSNYEITLREYLLSILFSKWFINMHDELIKSICILYNTFAYKMMDENGYISSYNSFALYKPKIEYKNDNNNYYFLLSKFNSIIDEVQCIYLSYDDNYILPFIHYVNGGKTNENIKYPYLSSVKSLWDMTSPNYINKVVYSYSEFSQLCGINIKDYNDFRFLEKNNSTISFSGITFSLEEFKNKFNLKSNDIYLIFNNKEIIFLSIGIGNGLGLSIYGANELANDGVLYNNILSYYFPKVKLYRYIKEKTSN